MAKSESVKTSPSTNPKMDVSLNGGTPISHPKLIMFSSKTNTIHTHLTQSPPFPAAVKVTPPFKVTSSLGRSVDKRYTKS